MTEYIKAHTKLPPYDPLPRFIWEMELSNTSIIIYSLLLGRVPLSTQNNWMDEDGNVYVRFTVDSIARKIHKSRSVIYSSLNELEAADLIKRKAGKGSRANRIFVKIFSPDFQTPPSEKSDDNSPENRSHIVRKTGNQSSEKPDANNNILKTNNNNIYKKGYRI